MYVYTHMKIVVPSGYKDWNLIFTNVKLHWSQLNFSCLSSHLKSLGHQFDRPCSQSKIGPFTFINCDNMNIWNISFQSALNYLKQLIQIRSRLLSKHKNMKGGSAESSKFREFKTYILNKEFKIQRVQNSKSSKFKEFKIQRVQRVQKS